MPKTIPVHKTIEKLLIKILQTSPLKIKPNLLKQKNLPVNSREKMPRFQNPAPGIKKNLPLQKQMQAKKQVTVTSKIIITKRKTPIITIIILTKKILKIIAAVIVMKMAKVVQKIILTTTILITVPTTIMKKENQKINYKKIAEVVKLHKSKILGLTQRMS